MENIRNVIIIGSGPAGFTAGIYTSRADLNPLMFAGEINGGQLMNTTLVENWPGSKEGVMGPELMMDMRVQAEKFGTEIIDKNVTKVDFSGSVLKVWVEEQEYLAKTVIIATGAVSQMTGAVGEIELLGRGVATCAVCDAAFYREKETFVVGGGDAAVEDTLALTKYAKKVTMVVRRDELKASKIMAKRVLEHDKVGVLWNSEIKQVKGDGKVSSIVIANKVTGQSQELPADGVFVAIGHKPATDVFVGQVVLDEKGYLITGLNGLKNIEHGKGSELGGFSEDVLLKGFPTMTSVKGVFGAGDVVDFRYRQAITSAGFACMAALVVEKYLETSA